MKTHTFPPHQTLQQLSRRYGLPVCMLLRANGGKLTDRMRIPPPDFCTQLGDCDTSLPLHWVAEGETLHAIARAHQVTAVDLMLANNLLRASSLQPGAVLRIPAPPPGTRLYTCTAADTFDVLARRCGMHTTALLALNGLSADAAPYPGLELYLPTAE